MTAYFLFAALSVFLLTGCSKVDFAKMPLESNSGLSSQTPLDFEKVFELAPSEASFQQQTFDENIVSVNFRAKNSDGSLIGDLRKDQILVQENSAEVQLFDFSSDSVHVAQTADIVFVVDITGTMGAFIETAKQRLKNFILSTRAQGYRTRMCISTFGDYTVKKCGRFFDNDPNDSGTEAQVQELITELSLLRSYKGEGQDPGWPDYDENPMGALIDAAQAPWGENSQRFIILVTDAGFLYSPGNQGTIGNKAPTMRQVNDAIQKSQAKVFAVTPNMPGYNSPFHNLPGIVQASSGEFFEFSKVLSGQISLDRILDRIIYDIRTTYRVTYSVDKNSGLNPSLPLKKRDIKVVSKSASGKVFTPTSIQSSMPEGHPEYSVKWSLSEHKVSPESAIVYINDVVIDKSAYAVQGGDIVFHRPPASGSKIRVAFEYDDFGRNLRLDPIRLPTSFNPESLEVYMNGYRARVESYSIEKDLDNRWNLRISDSVLLRDDPYEIRRHQGLHLRLTTQ